MSTVPFGDTHCSKKSMKGLAERQGKPRSGLITVFLPDLESGFGPSDSLYHLFNIIRVL